MTMKNKDCESYLFEPDSGIPNSPLPLLIWKDRLSADARSGNAACALFRRNSWGGTWVYTVFPYWHFHTRGHEVLACVSGSARIGFGGDRGLQADVLVGDVCVIPAGVGHKKLDASPDFQMAGGYPPGQEGNIVRPGEMDDERIAREISRLGLPQTDPITGTNGSLVEIWGAIASG